MKRFISREHAAHLKQIYMKTGLARQMITGIHNRQAAMYDILAEREQLPEQYDMHHNYKNPCYKN